MSFKVALNVELGRKATQRARICMVPALYVGAKLSLTVVST